MNLNEKRFALITRLLDAAQQHGLDTDTPKKDDYALRDPLQNLKPNEERRRSSKRKVRFEWKGGE